MIGEIEPLKDLQDPAKRSAVVSRILGSYPDRGLGTDQIFYRLRKEPTSPGAFREYDSPPERPTGSGRLDSSGLPVLYGSQDLEVCIHECRVSSEDELYVATLAPTKELRLLDLTVLLREEGATEFESLDLAVHMLFLAGDHSYEITREIARSASASGFDGLVYPSYFSLLRTGVVPFQTAYGISLRMFPELSAHEESKTIKNLALFGRPIEHGSIEVRSIHRLQLVRVSYDVVFGPAGVL
jgi:hypothetical protein